MSSAAIPLGGCTPARCFEGQNEILPGCAQTMLEAGEAITVITPTGGGFGAPEA
ncbi:5-oxoprolinase (ATP-hydrolysing) [Faunimonas pinastri]|uniref:5-oxoprolinase (ATP-hydrolysing) n=1 Tax=Faunimonas pinastri TaxID=1855383 RepID=A0A1H9M0H1_9HYPH|nr:hypothetical protein [Faunimonas pinastri]SER17184.1 5-oxoprolinase (ATP-hydrolysing) [Faunimonas pinastri]